MTGTAWDPPLAGTEETQLIGALERLRTTFRWKADGLDAAGLAQRAAASSLTLGGLLKHLALVEDHQFGEKLRRRAARRAVGGGRLGRRPRLGVQDRGGRPAADAVRAVGRRRRAVPAAAGRRPRQGRRARPAGGRQRERGAPQPAAAGHRHDRGVRSAHRARGPAPRGGGRPDRRGPAAGWRPKSGRYRLPGAPG